MIRYRCDMCKRELDPDEDLRYVVRVEIYAAADQQLWEDDDRDYLQEIQQVLEQLEDWQSSEAIDDGHQVLRFDLCAECRKKFLNNPLGKENRKVVDFSEN